MIASDAEYDAVQSLYIRVGMERIVARYAGVDKRQFRFLKKFGKKPFT